MKKLFKLFIVLAAAVLIGGTVFGAQAEITFVKGKLEVNRGNTWVELKPGDKVSESEVLSTGFQSEAKIKFESTLLYLGPLTRITLSALASSGNSDKVNVYLNTGAVRTKVTHPENKSVNYTVRTPISVASVRGTDVTADDSGTIYSTEGTVSVFDLEMLALNSGDKLEEALAEIENSEALPEGGVFITPSQSVTVGNGQMKVENEVQKQINTVTSVVCSVAVQEAVESGMSESAAEVEVASNAKQAVAPLSIVVTGLPLME